MRIASHKKISAQTEAWAKRQTVEMPAGWNEKFDECQALLSCLRVMWWKIEKDCPAYYHNQGGSCTCKEKPEYITLYLGQIIPLVHIVNQMFYEREGRYQALRSAHLARAIASRNARIAWKMRRRCGDTHDFAI